MSSYSVQVSGIAPTTTKQHLHDFFSFCGTIKEIDYKEKSATILFEKPSAAKTALMLNGGSLDGAHLTVTSDLVDDNAQDDAHPDSSHIDQSDKPRAGIAAEYLAKGYVLSDHVLQRAIEMDQERGISKRFLSYFHSVDETLGARALGPDQTISGKVTSTVGAATQTATQKAKSIDEQKGISKLATEYYSKYLSTPIGQKIRAFYTTTTKQVQDIHEEAQRLAAELKAKETQAPSTSSASVVDPTSASAANAQPTTQAAPTVV